MDEKPMSGNTLGHENRAVWRGGLRGLSSSLGERLPCKQEVIGSSPIGSTGTRQTSTARACGGAHFY